jgi:hypothetical protein
MPNQSKPYARQKKRCWCTPTCGKLLTAESRRRHYSILTPEEFGSKRDSESEEESTAQKSHRSQSQLHDVPSNYSLIGASESRDHYYKSLEDCLPDTASQDEIMSTSDDMYKSDYNIQSHVGLEPEERQKAQCSSDDEQMLSDSGSDSGSDSELPVDSDGT